jgi:UPF0755 protein
MRWFWWIGLIIVFLGVPGGAYGWYRLQLTPVAQAGPDRTGEEVLVDIPAGTSVRGIAAILTEQGLIRSELAFVVYAELTGSLLQAGTYRFSPTLSTPEVVTKLQEGDVAEHIVTVPEGRRLTEIAALLEEKNIVSRQTFLEAAAGKEGYLFPDTYRFPIGISAEEIVRIMRENFDTKTPNLSLTRNDIILASIIEREAKNDEERSNIASVYRNRLNLGMRLEADPTIQYAKTIVDQTITEFWPKITTADYRGVESTYNTYLYSGFPPGPICNPGLASLKAALSPAKTDYYFFFHTTDGETIFSQTLDEHNTKKSQYNLAN